MKKSLIFALLLYSVGGRCRTIGQTEEGVGVQSSYGQWGVDLDGQDLTVRPGDNFFRYATGRYLDRLIIPPDQSGYSTGSVLTDQAQARTRALLEDAAHKSEMGSSARMAGDYYVAFMNQERIEQLGIKPLLGELNLIRKADSRASLAALMGKENSGFRASIFHLDISPDLLDPTRYIVEIRQPELGLPDRSYYLDNSMVGVRKTYNEYIARLLELASWPEPRKSAEEIIKFETSVAQVSWGREQERDPTMTYNPMTLRELRGFARAFAWSEFLDSAGLSREQEFVVVEKSAIPEITALYGRVSLATIKAWAAFMLLDHAAPYLSKSFGNAAFELHGRSLKGRKEPGPRWKQALRLVGSANEMSHIENAANLGDVVGRLYVSRYFQPEDRAQVEMLVAGVKTAMRTRIKLLSWMEESTKTEALRKLEKCTIQVGYPDRWRSFRGLRINRDDLIGDIERTATFNWQFRVNRLHDPVDRQGWMMEPQTVNAYNEGTLQQIVFSAALLQPPVFDLKVDPAVNYGAIGAIIGHELTHGFDDQGRRFDSDGRMRDWWTPGDAEKFLEKTANLGEQFDACEPLPGIHVNGKLTMGENIADLGGLVLALDAYHSSLNGKPSPIIDGTTGDQRFFLSFAQVRRGKKTEEALRAQILTDPHSPDECRVNTEVRNLSAWYSAFDVKPGERLYLNPDNRMKFW